MKRIAALAVIAAVVGPPPLRPSSPSITGDSTVLVRGTTVPVKLSDALANVLNVKSFGARCDGSTNDTTAVTNALAALPAAGGTLNFPAGTCKFNLLTTRGGIVIAGSGSGNINTGLGGTVFTAATASSPILQFGDGAVTTSRGNMVRDVLMLGDGVNATGDAIYLYGARDFTADNVAISAMGRDAVRIQCNTTSSSGIHLNHMAIAGSKGANLRAEGCAGSFTSNITVTDSHFNDAAVASGGRAIYLDSTTVNLVNTYLDLHDGVGIQMVKNFSGNPNIEATGVNFDNADGSAATSMDVSTVYAAASRLSSAINGCFRFNGKVVYSDATVNESASRGCVLYQPWAVNLGVFNSLQFPISEAEAQAGGSAPTLSRAGATVDTDSQVILAHAAFKVPGAFSTPLQLGSSALYKNSNNILMWRKDASFPSAENNAQPIGWVLNTPSTASTTVTIDLTLGNVFNATYTTNANHTIAAPSGSGTGAASHSQSLLDICTINTSGGALGVFTWNANYHFVGGAQPATPADTMRSCVQFRQDAGGALWYETWRSGGDIPN